MKIKKILGTVLSLAIAASMFSACGAKPGSDSGETTAAADGLILPLLFNIILT